MIDEYSEAATAAPPMQSRAHLDRIETLEIRQRDASSDINPRDTAIRFEFFGAKKKSGRVRLVLRAPGASSPCAFDPDATSSQRLRTERNRHQHSQARDLHMTCLPPSEIHVAEDSPLFRETIISLAAFGGCTVQVL